MFQGLLESKQILAPKEILVRNGVGGPYESQVREHQNEPISHSPAQKHSLITSGLAPS